MKGWGNIGLTHTLSRLSKWDLNFWKMHGENLKIRRKRVQDYQTFVFIVCWSFPIMLVDSQIILWAIGLLYPIFGSNKVPRFKKWVSTYCTHPFNCTLIFFQQYYKSISKISALIYIHKFRCTVCVKYNWSCLLAWKIANFMILWRRWMRN